MRPQLQRVLDQRPERQVFWPVSRILQIGMTLSEEILHLGGNFGIQEENLSDRERIIS